MAAVHAIQCPMALFDTLGFQWNRDSVPREVPRASLERVVSGADADLDPTSGDTVKDEV